MAVNRNSGRLVVEIDPKLKLSLHAALAADGISLKEWVVQRALYYIDEQGQPGLFVAEPNNPAYTTESSNREDD